jgi:uncharacterized protein YegL
MKENYTHISLILDRSGSMQSIKNDTIGGVNAFLEEQKKNGVDVTVTFVQFDTHYSLMNDFTPISDVALLNESTYIPRASTALLDAIGRTVNSVGEQLAKMDEADRPSKVVTVIITDGFENASREFDSKTIKTMIENQTNNFNWEFVFLGANQDAILTSSSLGIRADSTLSYAATPKGAGMAFRAVSRGVAEYSRSLVGGGVSFMDEERTAQKLEGAL